MVRDDLPISSFLTGSYILGSVMAWLIVPKYSALEHYSRSDLLILTVFLLAGLSVSGGIFCSTIAMHKGRYGTAWSIAQSLELKTRKIIQWNLTENPSREFVKQRIQMLSEDVQSKKTLIYDNAPQFTSIDYSWYDIIDVNTCTSAPYMNAFVERLNGTIRREALDHFLLFSEEQVRKIVKEYVEYYNYQRPHQGINKIPVGIIYTTSGVIKKEQILGGLHHNYYQSSA